MKQVLTYRYRLLPTPSQHRALMRVLESQRLFYNAALEERIEAWKRKDKLTGKGISRNYFDQAKALTECRASMPDMAAVPLSIQRGTLRRLHKAFEAFYARARNGKTPGFPRFKGKGWWRSFEFCEFKGVTFDGKRLRSKAFPGGMRVHLHRPLPDTKILSARFKREVKGWYISLTVNVEVPQPRQSSSRHIGLDVGIVELAVGSDDLRIPNPRTAKRAEKELRRRQRALTRCKRGSGNRRKARLQVSRVHAKIANTRATYLHQQSSTLIANYDLIAVEKLTIANLTRSARGPVEEPGTNVAQKTGLNRAIHDAGWGKFVQFLDYKAVRAGVEIIKVDPRYTSQTCPECGHVAAENRPTRAQFHCQECGHDAHADLVGARNILARAGRGPGVLNVAGSGVRAPGNLTPRHEGSNAK